MRHSNIALFVPHRGCPHQCDFCNQHRITGAQSALTAEDVTTAVETALQSGKCRPEATEVAFFGGSFTAIPKEAQQQLLEAAYPYVEQGQVSGIRISTRPDCIDKEILAFLKDYGVTAVELGAQSMNDRVLAQVHRGHTAEDVANASRLIRSFGFSLGLQMMTGLPEDSPEAAMETARELLALQPDTMRIYPTLVLKDTPLAEQYRAGTYVPMSLEAAVALCSDLLSVFKPAGVRVIRLGLHDSEEVANRLAGPYHPAFAELCYSRLFCNRLVQVLQAEQVPFGQVTVAVSPRERSKAVGQKKSNQKALFAQGWDCRFIDDDTLAEGAFRVEWGTGKEVVVCS